MARVYILVLGLAGLVLASCSGGEQGPEEIEPRMISIEDGVRLDNAVRYSQRSEEDRARDKYRRPAETVEFFGVWSSAKVVELWPGGGWYTRVLVPYLNRDGAHGKLYLAHWPIGPDSSDRARAAVEADRERAEADPLYSITEVTALGEGSYAIAPDSSVDFVLTFRNLHNWLAGDYLEEVYAAAYRALEPGGVFGVVEHRAPSGTSVADMKTSGYVTQELAMRLGEEAGFTLEECSELNANPKDTADHPNGVWSLPPSLRGGDEDRERFLEIGESDRMTLRFRKPLDPQKDPPLVRHGCPT